MKKAHIIGLIIIAACIGVIISTVTDSSTYVNFATASQHEGKEFHVVGQLVRDKAMHYDPIEDPNYFSFYMIDNVGEERKVIFADTKPRDLEKSEQIVLIGKMEGKQFHASKILMKCPSKYVEEDIAVDSQG